MLGHTVGLISRLRVWGCGIEGLTGPGLNGIETAIVQGSRVLGGGFYWSRVWSSDSLISKL